MRLRRYSRPAKDPSDSGALNDLSFILIIFFIVTAGFTVNKGFLLNLPSAQKPRIVQAKDLLSCALDREGGLTLGGESVALAELRLRVREKLAAEPNLTFLLTIDPDTPYQSVVDVIHEVRILEVENFSFRMRAEGTP